MRSILPMILTGLCLLGLSMPRVWAQEEPCAPRYSFAVVPQQSASQLAQVWTPILDYLSQRSGVTLLFQTAKDIPEFENRLAQGQYDMAYMNPYHFTVFNQSPGYQAVAVRKDQPIRGIIVVHKDSALKSLHDLQGLTLAFPAPAAFAASVLPRAQLARERIAITPQYVSSHDSVYLNVAKGLFLAGGGVGRTFNAAPEAVRSQLRILWTTAAFTPHAFAAHPSMPVEHRQAIQAALVAMAEDEQGRALLDSIQITQGLRVATNADWDDVRALGIDLIDH